MKPKFARPEHGGRYAATVDPIISIKKKHPHASRKQVSYWARGAGKTAGRLSGELYEEETTLYWGIALHQFTEPDETQDRSGNNVEYQYNLKVFSFILLSDAATQEEAEAQATEQLTNDMNALYGDVEHNIKTAASDFTTIAHAQLISKSDREHWQKSIAQSTYKRGEKGKRRYWDMEDDEEHKTDLTMSW